MFKIEKLIDLAKKKQKTIVFPEASFSDRTVEAVKILQKKGIVKVMLVGDASALILRDKCFEKFDIVNPVTFPDRAKLVKALYEKRKEKNEIKTACRILMILMRNAARIFYVAK